MRLASHRLVLVPYTVELLQAEGRGVEHLAEALGVTLPAAWPPPLNDEDSYKFFLRLAEAGPPSSEWAGYYVLLQTGAAPQLVGNGGFKGPPDEAGCVEIGYSILPEFQRHGIATEMVMALCRWAFATGAVRCVCAHTLVDDPASSGVLRKCGFVEAGSTVEDGMKVLRYERRPSAQS